MKNALRQLPLLFALSAAPALANDTMAELKTGGLTFVRTPEVEMTKEALFISPSEIRVDYVFTNTSDKDVSSLVAFPMPDIGGDPYANIAIDDFETDNYLGFTAAQDGKAVAVTLQQRAYASDIDVTEDLKAQNIPLLPMSKAAKEALTEVGLGQKLVGPAVGGAWMDDYLEAGAGAYIDIFNFHGYPWLIHKLTYNRTNHPNLHVRGYKERGNINTPMELAIENEIDRFTLAIDVIDRVGRLQSIGAHAKEKFRNMQIDCRRYAHEFGIDRPDVFEWRWPY